MNKQINKLFKHKFTTKEFKTLLNYYSIDNLKLSYRLLTGDRSNYNIDDLIDDITKNIYHYLGLVLKTFTKEMHDYLLALIKNNGEMPYHEEIKPGLIVLMSSLLIGFPVTRNNEKIIIMANEILAFFKNYSFDKLTKQLNLNKLVCDYTKYLINIYGYFEVDIIFKQIKKWENLDLNFNDYNFLLNNDSIINSYEIINGFIKVYEIDEIPNFFEIRKKYNNFNYYQPRKNEIFEKALLTEAESEILFFCETELLLSKEMAFENLQFIKQSILLEYNIEEIMEIMHDEFELTKYEYKKLEKLIITLYHNTRLWSLKGHTRNEIKLPKLIKFPK